MRIRTIAPLLMASMLFPTLALRAHAQEAAPAERGRFTLSLNGAFGLGTVSYESAGRFRLFAEEASLDAAYENASGGGFEAGLAFRFNRRFGVGAAFTSLSRDGRADYRAEIPHPLYLARNRLVESTQDGLSYEEKAGHLDLVVSGRRGAVDLTAFAGPSLFSVKSSFLTGPPQITQTYPYDTVAVISVPREAGDAPALGFNLGAGIDFRVARHVALGAQARFSRASLELERPNADAVLVDAGGLQLTGGVRFLF